MVAKWFAGQAHAHGEVEVDVIDLADYPLPLEMPPHGEMPPPEVGAVWARLQAKLASAELYADAARYCMQMHGGYGYIDEHPLTMHYTDAVIATVAGGASQVQRNIVARELGLRPR